MAREPVLTFTDKGIYCPAGDFFIDPWRPVERALITHAHADHARAGHLRYLASMQSGPVLLHRLGDISLETSPFGLRNQIRIGDAGVSFHPAGHVPGSAQIRIEVKGEVWVVSGDYKVNPDGLSEPFEPVPCDVFVSESTFGLPVFRWREQSEIANQINTWWQSSVKEGKTPLLGAYSLGKAQRLLSMLDTSIGPILTHGAVENTTQVLRSQGYALPDTVPISPDTRIQNHPGAILLATPSAIGSAWARRFGPVSTALASGWMQLRGIRRRRAADRGFVISDHADWDGLNTAIEATSAEKIFVTHGYSEIFARWLNEQGYAAQVVPTEFEGETLDDAGVQ